MVDFLPAPRYARPASSGNVPRHGTDPAAAAQAEDPESGQAHDQSPERSAGEPRTAAAGSRTATTSATARSVSWNVPTATSGGPSDGSGAKGGGEGYRRGTRGSGGGRRSARAGRRGGRAPPLLLSWEGLRYEVPVPRRWSVWCGTNEPIWEDEEQGLLILDGVSGLAGPTNRRTSDPTRDVDLTEADLAAPSGSASVPSAREGTGAPGGDEDADGWEGTVTAIMGPSGAGKTSLLNALAGRLRNADRKSSAGAGGGIGGGAGRIGLTGAVRLNGEAVGAAQVRRVSAYVTQEDVLPETLTCYEHLMFHAHLRLPPKTSLARRHDRVTEVRDGGRMAAGCGGVCVCTLGPCLLACISRREGGR